MVYYSQLLGKPILDKNKNTLGKVKDFCFVDRAKYAVISGITLDVNGIRKMILWENVKEIVDRSGDVLPIGIYLNKCMEDLKFLEPKGNKIQEVIDKQLMDIDGARVIRVNDILLGRTGNKFILVGVDTSTRGILRRIGLEFLAYNKEINIILWKDVAPLSEDIKNLKLNVKRERINKLHPAEIADLVRDLSLEEKEMMFNNLSNEKAAETLLQSSPDVRNSFFKTMSFKKLARLLETLPSDDAAAILKMMPTINNEKILRLMKPGISAKVKKILSYRNETAGSLMTTRFLTVPEGLTARETIEYVRTEMPKPKHVFYLYVKGQDSELKGIISLRELILAKPDDLVSQLVKKEILTVNEDTDIDDVFNLMLKYGLLAIPVIDRNKKIVGVVRINDIMEEMIPNKIKKQRISKHKKLHKNSENKNLIKPEQDQNEVQLES